MPSTHVEQIERISWEEFCDDGLLWALNRMLHIVGRCIVVERDGQTGDVVDVYPARTAWRGFSYDDEDRGFKRFTQMIARDAGLLLREVEDE